MEAEPITRERMDELLRFLPLLDNSDERLAPTWHGIDRRPVEDGVLTMPYPTYPPVVEEFFRLVGQSCWYDSDYAPGSAGEMVHSDEAIASASLAQIKTMLTFCVRGERFCDGHWGAMIIEGRVGAILRRLQQLRELEGSIMADFGELKTLEPRSVWPNEARDFTPWLASNIGKLGDALGMGLEIVSTEADVGDFSLDILAKDLGTGRQVVIENQFGATDHDHLGKLLTYAAGLDAVAVIWVVEEVRDEHRQALEWLNRRTDAETHFFAVVIEVFQIDNSRPAFSFKPVVFPNEWQRATKESAERQGSPRAEAYRQFFQGLIDELREKHRFTGARAAQPQSWYSFSSGVSGVTYGASFALGGRVRTEVYIDQGELEKNKATFDALLAHRESIESEFGEPLEWERLDDRRASRVAAYREGTIDDTTERLSDIRSWVVDRLLRFRRVFGVRLQSPAAGRDVLNKPLQATAAPVADHAD